MDVYLDRHRGHKKGRTADRLASVPQGSPWADVDVKVRPPMAPQPPERFRMRCTGIDMAIAIEALGTTLAVSLALLVGWAFGRRKLP